MGHLPPAGLSLVVILKPNPKIPEKYANKFAELKY